MRKEFEKSQSALFIVNAIYSHFERVGEFPRGPMMIGIGLRYADALLWDASFRVLDEHGWKWLFETLEKRLEEAGAGGGLPSVGQLQAFRSRKEAVDYLDAPKVEEVAEVKSERRLSDKELKADWAHLLNCMEAAVQLGRSIPEHEARGKGIAKDAKERGLDAEFLGFAAGYPVIQKKVEEFF